MLGDDWSKNCARLELEGERVRKLAGAAADAKLFPKLQGKQNLTKELRNADLDRQAMHIR